MATVLKFKRRAAGGSAGAPAALKTAEPAYNMTDGKLYIGYGDDGSGNATSIKVFGKDDFLYNLPAGTNGKVLGFTSGAPAWIDPPEGGESYTAGTGLSLSGTEFSVNFSTVAALASPAFTGNPTAPTQTKGNSSTRLATTAYVMTAVGDYALQTAVDLKAPLASPALTGTPTAPTASGGTNNTQIATTAFVTAAINALVGGAGAAYDTLAELQGLIESDTSALSALTTVVGGKLQKDQNLSDLTNAATARTNLGLGSMATQSASSVSITGGTIDGITLDGGTF